VIALGKVGAPDRTCEQHVADEGKARRPVHEHHVARRVARAMDDVEFELAHGYGVAIDQPAVRLEALSFQAVALRRIVEAFDPETVALVRSFQRHAHVLRQDAGHAAVIHVAVRNQHLFQCHPGAFERQFQPIQVATGIDQRRLHRPGAPDERAVLFERSHRNDGDAHRELVSFGHGRDVAGDAADCNCQSRPPFQTTRPITSTSPAASSRLR